MELIINKKLFNTKPLEKFYDNDTPNQIIFGSAGSSKSYPIFSFCVLWMLQGRSILVCRKVARTLRKSCFSEVCKAINRMGLSQYFDINKTELTIISKISEGSCIMAGLDDAEKLKSITSPKSSSIDCVIFEEATEINPEDYDIANSRMRGKSKFLKKSILLFNPVSKSHWIYKRFFEPIEWDDENDNEYVGEDLYICRLLYTDNKFLDKSEIDRIESLKTISPRFYHVYGLGKFGLTEANVFTNFQIREIAVDELRGCQLKCGVDFGYQHLSSFIVCFYNSKERIIYITEEIGVRNKTRVEFLNMVKDKLRFLGINHHPILADSAEPASIQEARNMGMNFQQAHKGPDSIKRGYDFLQSCKIIINPTCLKTIEEFQTLSYEKDSFGNYKEEPVKVNDDMIAALRYSVSDIFMMTHNIFGFKSKNLY